jgi:hypothetical protein
MSAEGWEFYDVLKAVIALQRKHEDDVLQHYLVVAHEALDAAAARLAEVEAAEGA